MLKKLLFYSCLLVLMACANQHKPNPAALIPKETALVMVINTPLLIDKIKTNAFIQLDSVLKDMLTQKDNDDFRNQLAKLNESIDLQDKLYLFITPKTLGGKTAVSINIAAYLKDAQKLASTLKENKTWKYVSMSSTPKFQYAIIDNKFEISWNKDMVICSINPDKDSKQYDFKTHTAQYIPADTTALIKQVAKYYDLAENESIASIKQFNDLLKTPADLYTFSNSSFLTTYTNQLTIQPVRLDSFISNNYYAATIQFEKGKAVMNGNIYLNEALTGLSKRYATTAVNTHLLDYYPSQNVNSFVIASFHPSIVEGLLKDLDIAIFAEAFLQKSGMNLTDITQSIKGDIGIAFSDFRISNTAVIANSMLEVGTLHKANLDKSLDLITSLGYLTKKGNDYAIGADLPIAGMFHSNNDKLVFASNPMLYNQYTLGKIKNNIPDEIKQQLKGKTSAGFLNIDSYLSGIDDAVLNGLSSAGTAVKSQLKGTLNDAYVYSETGTEGVIKTHGELRLKDKEQNSLIQLHNMTMHIMESISKERNSPTNSLNDLLSPSH